jgi:hypothetical protein
VAPELELELELERDAAPAAGLVPAVAADCAL